MKVLALAYFIAYLETLAIANGCSLPMADPGSMEGVEANYLLFSYSSSFFTLHLLISSPFPLFFLSLQRFPLLFPLPPFSGYNHPLSPATPSSTLPSIQGEPFLSPSIWSSPTSIPMTGVGQPASTPSFPTPMATTTVLPFPASTRHKSGDGALTGNITTTLITNCASARRAYELHGTTECVLPSLPVLRWRSSRADLLYARHRDATPPPHTRRTRCARGHGQLGACLGPS